MSVSPLGNWRLRLPLTVLAWLPLAGQPDELSVLMQRDGDCRTSHTCAHKDRPVSDDQVHETTWFLKLSRPTPSLRKNAR